MTAAPLHPLTSGISELAQTLDSLAAFEPAYVSVAERRNALLSLAEIGTRLQALRGRVMAASGDVARDEGQRDIAAWLTHRTRAASSTNRRDMRLAQACDERWHALGTSLMAGGVNADQAHVITRALDDLASASHLVDCEPGEWPDILVRAESHLIEMAATFGPKELRRIGERILDVVAPDYADQVDERLLRDAEAKARRVTSLTIRSLGDGTALIKARVPEVAASRLRTALEAFTNPRKAPSETGSAGGATARPVDKVPYDRRLGQAFCSLLETLDPSRLPLHGGDATTLVVTVSLETLVRGIGAASLADGSRLSAGEARRLACTAGIVPAVLGSRSVPLDLGRQARLYSSTQRRAMALRDGGCVGEGCTIPATWCEAHHLRPWSHGGRTDLDDGVLLCAHHHQLIHDARYVWERPGGGRIRFARRGRSREEPPGEHAARAS